MNTRTLASDVNEALRGARDGRSLEDNRAREIRKAMAEATRHQRLAAARPSGSAAKAHRLKAAQAFARAVALQHLPAAMDDVDPERIAPGRQVPLRTFLPPSVDLPLGVELPGQLNGRLAAAADKAGLWRYEHLVELARKSALDAVAYESQLTQVLQMALTKGVAAQEIVGPALLEAVDRLEGAIAEVVDLTSDDQVTSLLNTAADLALQQVMLALILKWFLEHDAIEFWIGLFGAIINDIAGFSTSLSHTKDFLDHSFSLLPGLSTELRNIERDLEQTLDTLLQPLKDSVAGMVSSSNNAISDLMSSFDLPITAGPPPIPGMPDVLNINPLARVEGDLEAAVARVRDELMNRLKGNILDHLNEQFREVMTIFVVVPVLAVLAIGIATGPIGAAALAAVVLIAAQELVHLILTWLSGPLQGVLDDLRKRALAALDPLKNIVAGSAGLIDARNPAHVLDVVASQLRELKNLLPGAFLDDVAHLLESARDAVLDSATDLALAAEQALGLENGTAFDLISPSYGGALTAAPQLPGGDTSRLFASALLLRDLEKLDHARTDMKDGRETDITHRISLRDLLGDAGFTALLSRGEVVLPLHADTQLRPSYPGIYRALIKEIRPALSLQTAATSVVPAGLSIPITLTHLGENRARIKRDGNPSAPPLSPPYEVGRGYVAVTSSFLEAVDHAFYASIRRVVIDAQTGNRRRGFPGWLGGIFGSDFLDDLQQALHATRVPAIAFLAAWREALWNAVKETSIRESAGLMDPAAILAPTDEGFALLAERYRAATFDVSALDTDNQAWHTSSTEFTNSYITGTSPGMAFFVMSAYGEVVDQRMLWPLLREWVHAQHSLDAHIAKWGAARYEADPSPAAGALGFTTLVRDDAEETACFSLVSGDGNALLLPIGGTSDGVPPAAASLLRYRSFENRGFDGVLRLTLPAVAEALASGQTPTGVTDVGWLAAGRAGAVGAVVEDLIIDVVVRACYDTDLAATTRATRDHERLPTSLARGSGTRQRILLSLRDIASRGGLAPAAHSLAGVLPPDLSDLDLTLVGQSLLNARLSDLIPVHGGTVGPEHIRVVGVGAAVIPSREAMFANPPRLTELHVPGASALAELRLVGGAQGAASPVARNVCISAARPLEADETEGITLADLLGTPALFRVPELGAHAADVYDVLFSITVEIDAAALPTAAVLAATDGPLVLAATPPAGPNGTEISITGQRLSGTGARVALVRPGATWDGTATAPAGVVVLTPTSSSATNLRIVASGLTVGTTYAIHVSVGGRIAIAPTGFACVATTPVTIESVDYTSGTLQVLGTGLGAASSLNVLQGATTVLVRSAPSGFSVELVDAATDRWRLRASAMLSAGSYTLRATVGTANPTRDFAVSATGTTAPAPTAFSPNNGLVGAEVRIIGTSLDQVTEVQFRLGATVVGTATVAPASRSATEVRVVPPATAVAGSSYSADVRAGAGPWVSVPGTYQVRAL
ncbi:MAG: hypothetical protein JJD92_09240 [Frankiaceae bacterium]|nr:hypothetical protein [Frankiaceae bacterium]